MHVTENSQDLSFQLPERTVVQLDELVRMGRFASRQTAVAAAMERLHTEECPSLETRRAALARVGGSTIGVYARILTERGMRAPRLGKRSRVTSVAPAC